MDKSLIQNEAIKALKENKRIILTWATGVGKGYTAVQAIKELNPKSIIIFVTESAHKNNWKEEFIKSNCSLENIKIECYASIKKYKNSTWDLIIFDEAHHLGSDIRLEILRTLTANRVLVLSATINNKEIINTLTSTFGIFKTFNIDLQSAINNDYLPDPKLYLMALTLDNKIRSHFVTEEWGNKAKRKTIICDYTDRWNYIKYKKTIYPNVLLKIRCTEQEVYNYYTEKFNYYQKQYMLTRNERIKQIWLHYGSLRKRALGQFKTPFVKSLLKKLEDKRLICFCSSIEQATLLGGNNCIHSKNTKKENQILIDNFNNEISNKIFVIGMLQEGQNLNNIETGIIVQLDGIERAFIQKFGRVLRAEDPVQYIFYFKYTKDEDYLKNVTENIDSKYLITYNIKR